MQAQRNIRKICTSKPVIEGAGVHLKRAFGFREAPMFDPFLLFDDFRSDDPAHYQEGFPWHPHRGIETITYVLCGDVEHGDSMGNKGDITSGDVQWMTAGSGVIHQEMPKGDAQGRMEGFQLWANLPSSHKMMAPRYQEIQSAQIPHVVLDNGVTIKIICGQVGDTTGPVRDIVIEPQYLDISVPPQTTYIHPTRKGHTVIAYIIDGSGYFCPERKPFTLNREEENFFDMENKTAPENGSLLLFGDGDSVFMNTEEKSLRILLFSGKPLNEPIAWRGPIVMNTQEELQKAFEEYENGTFIKNT